jgi:hypothetical protein
MSAGDLVPISPSGRHDFSGKGDSDLFVQVLHMLPLHSLCVAAS